MGDLKDGRYGFKINAKNAVVEIYMVKGEVYFDLFGVVPWVETNRVEKSPFTLDFASVQRGIRGSLVL
jgi:hypothetical protein